MLGTELMSVNVRTLVQPSIIYADSCVLVSGVMLLSNSYMSLKPYNALLDLADDGLCIRGGQGRGY